jgi:hypothetical protein
MISLFKMEAIMPKTSKKILEKGANLILHALLRLAGSS